MTVDPAIVTAVIAAFTVLGGLLVAIFRLFLTGALMSKNTVPREDYEAMKAVNASYAAGFTSLTAAVKKLGATVENSRKPRV